MAKRKKTTKKKRARAPAIGTVPDTGPSTTLHGVLLRRTDGTELSVPHALYERATKKVGLDNSRIVAFPTAAALKKFCDKTHPASNPDALPQAAPIPEAKTVLEPPDKIEFDSKLEAQFITMNRASFDNNTLQAEMRKVNRKYGTQKSVRIMTDQACKAVDGKDKRGISVKYLITHYVVYYK